MEGLQSWPHYLTLQNNRYSCYELPRVHFLVFLQRRINGRLFLPLIMETRKQKLLVKKIVDAKNVILKSTDRETVTELVKGIIDTALPISPAYSSRFDNRSFKDFSKASAIKLL